MMGKQEIYEGEKPVYAEVVIRSKSGLSLLKKTEPLCMESLDLYKGEPSTIDKVGKKLETVGFETIASSPFGLSIIGPKTLYLEYLKTDILCSHLRIHRAKRKAMQLAMTETLTIPEELKEEIETIYIPPSVRYHSIPNPTYEHKTPPDEIASLIKADGAHSPNNSCGRAIKGKNVKVAMVDSGLKADHLYYQKQNYTITLHGINPAVDDEGHGTGMATNLLAIAPECDFHFFKVDPTAANLPAKAAFDEAVKSGAKIISNSWGCKYDPLLEASIKNAVKMGITVVFSCGDKGLPEKADFPGCMYEVISVGGVFPGKRGLEASSFALSGCNSAFPDRHCPDVCGICGQGPRGIFIIMPTQPGSYTDLYMDANNARYPYGDRTGPKDGWFVGSGTSAAAPQVAGGAALLLDANPNLTPSQIKQILEETASDVTTGKSATGEKAWLGKPDDATGYGLINLTDAVNKVCG